MPTGNQQDILIAQKGKKETVIREPFSFQKLIRIQLIMNPYLL